MAGKRLLDALQFLNVAKSVAGKHLAIRQQQLDVYTRTSSITKGLKERADNWVITAQAASALARRFNETSSSPWSPDGQTAASTERDSTSGIVEKDARPNTQPTEHVNQNKSDNASQLQGHTEFQIPAKQAAHDLEQTADDLTVSRAQDTFYSPSLTSTTGASSLPKVKIPETGGVSQTSEPHVASGPINSDVFHSHKSTPAELSEEALLQGVFRSQRVASLLLSKKKNPYIPNKEPIGIPKNGLEKNHDGAGVASLSDSATTEERKVVEGELASTLSETLPEDIKVCRYAKFC
jgi:aarF domain-containing kinase